MQQVVSFGEVLIDGLPSGNVVGGAPLNVLVHLQSLGIHSAIISKIGTDDYGHQIQLLMNKKNVDQLVQIDHAVETGYVKVNLKNGIASYEILRNKAWEQIDYVPLDFEPIFFVFGSLALYSDSNKESFKNYHKDCKNTNFICDINLRSPLYDKKSIEFCLQHSDILKINDEELEILAKLFNWTNVQESLKNIFGIHKLIVTKGSKGADLYFDHQFMTISAPKVNVLEDTVGAGDAFLSYFIYGIIHDLPIDVNLKNASDFAAAICAVKGAIPKNENFYTKYIL